jgi:hypothetical protein
MEHKYQVRSRLRRDLTAEFTRKQQELISQASTGRIDAQWAKERISDIQVLIQDLNAPAETTTRSKQ